MLFKRIEQFLFPCTHRLEQIFTDNTSACNDTVCELQRIKPKEGKNGLESVSEFQQK